MSDVTSKYETAVWKDEVGAKTPEGLPSHQLVSWFEYKSDLSGKLLTGSFTFEKLTPFKMVQVDAERARITQNQSTISETANAVANWFAHFKLSIVNAPEWWNPEKELDDELLMAVYIKIVSWEDSFRRSAKPERPPTPSASEGKRQEPVAETLVGEEVSASTNV